MLNPSAYALGANRSCIRDLFEYGCQRAAVVGRENVYDYSLGNPSIPSPKEVDETVRRILDDTDSLLIHGYTSAVGDYATRKAISDDLNARYGVSTVPEEFFIGCGAAPELVSVFRALAVPGAEILAVAPYFPEYKPFAQEAGLEFKVVPADIPSFQINLTAMEQMITPSTQAVILNSPNTPSGVVYTRETYQALAEILNSKAAEYGHPIYIVSDEPYRELAYGVEVPFLPEIYRDTVICYYYSKSLSLPGERIGYVYVPSFAEDSAAVYATVSGAARAIGHVCPPTLMQKVVGLCAREQPDLQAYDENRTLLYNSLREMGYECAKPDGAFYLFVKAPGGDANAFSEKAKREHNLLVVPADGFGCPGYFRLSYCVSNDMIRRSLPAFRAMIKAYC